MDHSPLLGLRWAIKRSFLEYIARAPGGRGSLTDGAVATEDKEIVFAQDSRGALPPAEAQVSLAFRGAVTFSAHGGVLLVPIANPWITIRQGSGELTVADPFDREKTARLRLATFEIDAPLVDEGFEHWSGINVRLAPEACPLFNHVYPAWEMLEPLTIIVPADPGAKT